MLSAGAQLHSSRCHCRKSMPRSLPPRARPFARQGYSVAVPIRSREKLRSASVSVALHRCQSALQCCTRCRAALHTRDAAERCRSCAPSPSHRAEVVASAPSMDSECSSASSAALHRAQLSLLRSAGGCGWSGLGARPVRVAGRVVGGRGRRRHPCGAVGGRGSAHGAGCHAQRQ